MMVIMPPVPAICTGVSGRVAGPDTTLPSLTRNVLPWQGQSIVPFATLPSRQPTWGQTALKALNSPATGWVTTMLSLRMTMPPPTGMSALLATWIAIEPDLAAQGAAQRGLQVTADVRTSFWFCGPQ